MIRRFAFVFSLSALSLMAAVTGTVTNRTTGQPEAGITVTLYKFGQGGMQPVTNVKTDPQGKFNIDQNPQGPGPAMVRVEYQDVTYNHMMPPGSPTTDIPIDIYAATQKPAGVQVSKHMLLFEPSGDQMVVNETLLVKNEGKSTWTDPKNGTIKFFLPESAKESVDAKGTAPDGMPITIPTAKTAQPGIYTAKFEVKPGETRFDLTYSVPYTAGATYSGKIPTQDENTYLIAPNGVTLEGKNLSDMGNEPRTQAHIYGLKGNSYQIQLTGATAPAPDAAAAEPDNSGPQIEQILPRVNSQTKLILGLALGILGLGFVLLYRAQPEPSKETNERGRR